MKTDFIRLLWERQWGLRVLKGVQMRSHTSFRIGGQADFAVSPSTVSQLIQLLGFLSQECIPYRIIGNGTNLLVSDSGYRGVVVFTGDIRSVTVRDTYITAEAGAGLSRVATAAKLAGLSGMEALYGIPGTVGGALVMNAGAFGTEIGSLVEYITVYDPQTCEVRVLDASAAAFGYRDSLFRHQELCILSARLRLQCAPIDRIEEQMYAHQAARKEKQPLNVASAGSYFRRPAPTVSAGELIDRCGLKGLSVGDAAVSEKHAGFLVNRAHATARQVLELAELVRSCVSEQTGYTLEPEVEYLG